MLTKPDIADKLIISRLQDEYNLHFSTLTFLPLGADMGTAVYCIKAGKTSLSNEGATVISL
ncbi:MAG TPA: hypothetical protein VIS72_05315 [Anaerolineales bacterium]